jgi:chorismate synthase
MTVGSYAVSYPGTRAPFRFISCFTFGFQHGPLVVAVVSGHKAGAML